MIQRASDLPAIDRDTVRVNAVIETSRNARAKLDYDPESGYYKLHDVLPEGLLFPFNFVFIPSTWRKTGIRSTSLSLPTLFSPPIVFLRFGYWA